MPPMCVSMWALAVATATTGCSAVSGCSTYFSMLPTFVVYNRNNMTIRGERKKAEHIRFNMLFNERAAIVHFFSPRHFAGATLVVNSSLFSDDAVVINQNKWRLRAFLGMRL